jgi:hypothetical protein
MLPLLALIFVVLFPSCRLSSSLHSSPYFLSCSTDLLISHPSSLQLFFCSFLKLYPIHFTSFFFPLLLFLLLLLGLILRLFSFTLFVIFLLNHLFSSTYSLYLLTLSQMCTYLLCCQYCYDCTISTWREAIDSL